MSCIKVIGIPSLGSLREITSIWSVTGLYFLEYTPSSLTSDRQGVDLVYLSVLNVSSPLIHQAAPPAVTTSMSCIKVIGIPSLGSLREITSIWSVTGLYFLEYTPSSLTSDRQGVDLVYLSVLNVSSPLIHQAAPPAITLMNVRDGW